jgi:pyruvate dehydrogenase E2 component (dihydrolipoamide acetyltransferase)
VIVPTEIVIPEVGEGGIEVTLARWLVHEGDGVEAGRPIFELDTQKAVLEVQAVVSGIVARILVGEGEIVQPRQVVGVIAAPGESLGPPAPEQKASGKAATPRARRIAAERAIDLSHVAGSGPDGLVTERDLNAHHSSTVDGSSRTQAAVARRTSESWRTIPHFYLTLRADVTDRLTEGRITPLIVHACVRALGEHPECRLAWADGAIVKRDRIDVGLLVDTPRGLLLPRVEDAGRMSMTELALALSAAADRARAGRLASEDAGERTITISNLGMFSVDTFAGVIPTPDVLLLSVGRLQLVPVMLADAWMPRKVIELTLAVDHRAVNGADAAALLTTLERILATPEVKT